MASLWDSFKKKIEKQWERSDFWDKEENARQMQAYEQPRPQPTRPQTSGINVDVARPTQSVQIDTAPAPNFNMNVAQPKQQPNINLPQQRVNQFDLTPEERLKQSIEKSLNLGKSWEDISRETRVPLQNIRQYSQATRPNYGIQMEKPQQNFWDKARDVVDANTPMDQYRRYQDNQSAVIAGKPEEQVPVVSVNPGNLVTNTVGAIPRMANTLANQAVETGYTTQQQFATAEYSAATQAYMQAVKTGDPELIARTRQRANDAAQRVSDINTKIAATKSNYGTGGGLFNAGTMYNEEDSYTGGVEGAAKIVGNTVEGAADVVSLGMASVPKGIFKAGVKEGIVKAAPTVAKTAGVNFVGNAANVVGQGGDAEDALKAGVAGAALGTAGDFAGNAVGRAVAKGSNKGRNKIAQLLAGSEEQAPSVFQKVNPDTGERVYKVIDPKDFDKAKADVDGGFAGTRQQDGFTPHITAKTPEQMEALGFKSAGKYNPEVDGVNKPVQGAVKGKTQQIGDLMDINRFGKQITENIDERLAKEHGIDASTVRRLRNGYGEEKLMSVLNPNKDLVLNTPGRANDKNAFIVKAMRDKYGSPNVRIAREPKPSSMTPEELASLEASAPQTSKIVQDLTVDTPAPKVEAPKSKLGSIVEEFYDKAKGNNKIKFSNLQDLGQRVSRQIDDDLTVIGSDFSDVARRIQEGARNGIRTLDEVLTPEEAQIIRKAQAEMNYIRRRASLGRKEISEGDFGEMYLPQQAKGQYDGARLFEGFRDTKPGSEFARKNKIDLEDLDYSSDVIGQYIARYGDTKLFREERIARAIAKNNPNLDEELIQKAAQGVIALQDKVNKMKTKIGAFGLGTRKTLADGEFVDVAGEMSTVGKGLGREQITLQVEPKGFTNGERINSVMVGDKTLGDYLGLNQYRDSKAYAAQQVLNATDRGELARMVEQRLMRDYNLSPEDLEYAVGGIARMPESLPDEVVNARVLSTYTMAAKQQMMEQLQNLDIKNPKLRKEVSAVASQILREGTIEDQMSNKIVKGILRTQNAIFRKLNVSSALNELSDLTSFRAYYGGNLAVKPDFNAISRYGLGDIDAAIEPYIKQVNDGVSLHKVLRGINNATNLYKFVEAYKAGIVANSVRKAYPELSGDALTKKMLQEYRDLALPVDAFTKTFLDNTPLYTQYMTWGARNIQKEYKLATGKFEGGAFADKTKWERIARNAYANLPAKTVFWLSSNALKGTGILTAIGLTDFTGLTSQDYSGIEEQDKSFFDDLTRFTNQSTTLSMLNKLYQTYEIEQLKQKYADKDYNPYGDEQWDKSIIDMFKPQFAKNVQNTQEMIAKGFSENASGRVQYEAPTDWWNTAKSYVFGKGNTENAREYSGRLNIWDRVSKGENPFGAMIDMAKEQVGVKDTDYNRPLTEKYSDAYKKAEKGSDRRDVLLAGGRAFNNFLDDFRQNNPEQYGAYINAISDGNHVNPEYWKAIGGEGDMTTFNMIRDRKKQEFKDLGTAYDPIYDLKPDQAKAVIQQKATATGDDIALRNSLYKEQWYKDYMDKVKGYYDAKGDTEIDGEQTQRVKEWYSYNDEYNSLRTTTTENGERPKWATKFPTVYAQKVINQQYGFNSEESKNFFRNYGDQYKAEKAAYDGQNLALINKMREIEGYPPMSDKQYAQVTEIADTEEDSDNKGSSSYSKYSRGGGSSGGGGSAYTSFADKGSFKLPTGARISTGVKVARKKAYKPKQVKIQRKKA